MCRHHWIIQPALDYATLARPTLPGRCRKCGEEREFRNVVDLPEPTFNPPLRPQSPRRSAA